MTPAREGSTGLRVLTLPREHAYLDRVLPLSVVRVRPGPPVAGFGPDPLWDPAVLAASLGDVDVVHVHFGFDHLPPALLRRWVSVVREAGCSLVVTVHDLRNPHHPTPSRHAAQLRVLLPAADAVLTLTPRAARTLERAYGRHAEVAPHPAVFDGAAEVPTERGLVGLHLKSLRRNVVGLPAVVAATAQGVAAGGGHLWVGVHHEVAAAPSVVAAARHARVVPHARLDDAELRAFLTRLHVLVLPQRFGTHSGLLEACRDVGTAVVAPRCGCYLDQWPQAHAYDHDEERGLSAASLSAAVVAALAEPPPAPVARAVREAQGAENRAVHARTYARVADAACAS